PSVLAWRHVQRAATVHDDRSGDGDRPARAVWAHRYEGSQASSAYGALPAFIHFCTSSALSALRRLSAGVPSPAMAARSITPEAASHRIKRTSGLPTTLTLRDCRILPSR